MAKAIRLRSRRDPVLVRLFQESGHSYETGVTWLIDKLRDSLAQQPMPAAPRRVTYQLGTLDQLPLIKTSAGDEAPR